jgi:hypothetical protein
LDYGLVEHYLVADFVEHVVHFVADAVIDCWVCEVWKGPASDAS